MIRVKQCTSFDELTEYAPIWNTLLRKSKDNDVFSTWEWISCWWKHLGGSRELRVLIAEENEKIMAIAPLMFSKYSVMKLWTINKIEFVGSPQSDYNNFIWIEKEEQCLGLFLEHLLQQTDWDTLELTYLREGTLSATLLHELGPAMSSKLENRVLTTCPYIQLPSSKEEFHKSLGPWMRRNLRKQTRRLGEDRIGLKTHLDYDSLEEAMDLLFDLHERRWRGRGELGVFADREVAEFHRELAGIFDKNGWLALSFLTVDNEPVAAEYSFDYREKRYGYQSGFDPGFSHYSVGSLLRLRNIETCITKHLTEYDFSRGGQQYKHHWPTQVRNSFCSELVRKGSLAKIRRQVEKSQVLPQGLLRKLGRRFVLQSRRAQSETE
jgi:CelD/BcsL family acetyltransferase involved in cellulose biosynthesis